MKKVVFGVMVLLTMIGSNRAFAQDYDIALLVSSNTLNYYFTKNLRYGALPNNFVCEQPNFLGPNEYQRYYKGWQYVLDGQQDNGTVNALLPPGPGLPASYDPLNYTVLSDDQVTEKYLTEHHIKLLILANAASLPDNEQREIHQWVLKGGNLIATYGSGYKDIIENLREDDTLKLQKGGTFGIHQLWHDPITKAFGTNSIPGDPGIDVAITKSIGPTDLFGPGVISYGAEANLLTQRPEMFRDALAFLTFDFNLEDTVPGQMDALKKLYPAILLTKMSRGRVIYFAFAPEFIVSLAFDLAGHCSVDGNYPGFGHPEAGLQLAASDNAPADIPNGYIGAFDLSQTPDAQLNSNRVTPLLNLMKRTIDYMLTP